MLKMCAPNRCRMVSPVMPIMNGQRDGARLLAASAEAARRAENATSMNLSPEAATEAAEKRREAREPIPAVWTYNPRTCRGEPFSFRVNAILEAHARLHRLRSPTWYTMAEASELGLTLLPGEKPFQCNIGLELVLMPFDALPNNDAQALLSMHRLPRADSTFRSRHDQRLYHRPMFLRCGRWKQSPSSDVNTALIKARIERGLSHDLWIDEIDFARAQLVVRPEVGDAGAPLKVSAGKTEALVNADMLVQLSATSAQ